VASQITKASGCTRWSQLGVHGCEVGAGAQPHASRIEFLGGSLARQQSDFPSGSLPLRRINGIRGFQLDPALHDNCFNFSVPIHKRERRTEQLVAIQNLGKTWVKNPPFSLPFSPFLSTKPSEIIGTSA
jgi:hypothetical protein